MKIQEKKDSEQKTVTEEMGEIILDHPFEEGKEIILEPGDRYEVINESEEIIEDSDVLDTKPEILEKYKKKNEEDDEDEKDMEQDVEDDKEKEDDEEDEVEEKKKKKKESTDTNELEKIDDENIIEIKEDMIVTNNEGKKIVLEIGQKIKVL